MREDLDRLLDDLTLMTLGLAIALGWSLYQVAHGVAVLLDGLSTHLAPQEDPFSSVVAGGGMTWAIGHHILTLDQLVVGLIELAVVLAVALWLSRRSSS
jgi:hypothetical protein